MLTRIPIFWKLTLAFAVVLSLAVVGANHLGASIAVAAGVALSGAVVWLVVNGAIKRPIRDVIHGMNQLAEKRFEFRLDEDERAEFGSLASSFNDMASLLSSSLTELKKARDHLHSILESSADIIITVNPSGKIQTLNRGAELALGHRRLDVVGQPLDIVFADPQEREAVMGRLKHTDTVINYETRFSTKGGEVRDVLLSLSLLRNPAGAVIGTIGIGKDITLEKRLQDQLIESQRFAAIGQVFTGLQHSMKNMLNACKGGSYMVRTGLAKDNRKMLEEGWEIVEEGISKLTNMSSDMLKYVKEWKPTYGRADLSQTLAEIERVIRPTAKDKGVEFRLAVSGELPFVFCDARMIHSAVMDIVSNALDACLWKDYDRRETPEVVVSAYPARDGQDAVIEVKDNGCGMTDEVKANLFTPFFSTKSKAGTGLGLSIASRMIGVHGGRIDVESEPNHGAVFRIVLPVEKTAQPRGA